MVALRLRPTLYFKVGIIKGAISVCNFFTDSLLIRITFLPSHTPQVLYIPNLEIKRLVNNLKSLLSSNLVKTANCLVFKNLVGESIINTAKAKGVKYNSKLGFIYFTPFL